MINERFSNAGRAGARLALLRGCSTAALGAAGAAMIMAAAPAPNVAALHGWTPKVLNKPPASLRAHTLAMLAAHGVAPSTTGPGLTVPYWTTSITSPLDNNTYTVSMVGSSPYAARKTDTIVPYVPVALRVHLGGYVLDPTVKSHCDNASPAKRFFDSPLFHPANFVSNGVTVSAPTGSQLISAFQRANFWQAVQGTNYGVSFKRSTPATTVVDWTPTNPLDFVLQVPDNCGGTVPVAIVNINEFNDELLAVAAQYGQPNQVPVTLANDLAIYVGSNTNNCCVLGYHNAVPVSNGTQLYAVGAYFDTNSVFGPGFADITIWSHELGELVDDPFVQSIPGVPGGTANDLTPAWGHTGQQGGCQNNLEVGDPLTPSQFGNFTNYPVAGIGNFVYHYQDLAFHDWFYRTPSTSTGGAGSFVDNLAGGGQATICH